MSVAGGGNDRSWQGRAWWEAEAAGKPLAWAASGCRIDDGQWHHVVGTAASQELRLYVDGELVGKAPKPSVGSSACDLTIGLGRGTPVEPFLGLHVHKVSFSGAMDDVMLFDRELSPEEVKALYESQK